MVSSHDRLKSSQNPAAELTEAGRTRRVFLSGLSGAAGLALASSFASAASPSATPGSNQVITPDSVTPDSVTPMQALLDAHLKPGVHPRLHRNAAGWLQLQKDIKADAALTTWYARLQAEAAKLMNQAPAEYKLIGPRLLTQSRRALHVISTLGGLYRLDGDERKAVRARMELRAICAFPDWHPPHFLDVAELANAAALGYDWLYDALPDAERTTLRARIIEYALRPGLQLYNSGVWWSKPYANNWGQVCAGGLTMGALAIANDDPTPASEPAAVLTYTTEKVRNNMMNYAPDGGWPEGPSYWSYATKYTCAMISALESSLQQDFGLSQMAGFDRTGTFRVASIGPSDQLFNYADGGAMVGRAPEMIWLGRRFKTPLYAVSERRELEHYVPDIFHLVWSAGNEGSLSAGSPPLDVAFTRVDVAYLRSSWTDAKAFFVGIKGGGNAISHAHLDLGSFVMDALGERWALDLGPDNYDLPEYFGKERWTYYRLRTEGHNTLTLGTANQNVKATARIAQFTSEPERGSVVVDLTDVYTPDLTRVTRQVTLSRGSSPSISLVDRVEGGGGKTLRWNMHTRASIEVQGTTATLTLHGKRLRARLSAPAGAAFQVIGADAPLPQAQQPDVRNLTVTCALSDSVEEIQVHFEAV